MLPAEQLSAAMALWDACSWIAGNLGLISRQSSIKRSKAF
jgi:hypothetical protein